MKIRDIMTANPKWCIPEDMATKAARMMKEMDVGIVPVVKSPADRTIVGVVTDRDLCLGVLAADTYPNAVPIQKCMTTNIVACQPTDDVQQATKLMEANQVRRIPVIDQRGMLQGMISLADICQRGNLPFESTHRLLQKVSEPMEHASKPRAMMMELGHIEAQGPESWEKEVPPGLEH